MQILNAIASGGDIFDAEDNLIHPEWPKNGYLRCPTTADQELFQFLEEAQWSNGNVLATARWYERQNDNSSINPRWTIGSICFRGSGIHFHLTDRDNNVSQSNLHFLCEVPWKDTFDTKDDRFTLLEANASKAPSLLTSRSNRSSANRDFINRRWI